MGLRMSVCPSTKVLAHDIVIDKAFKRKMVTIGRVVDKHNVVPPVVLAQARLVFGL